MSFTGVSGGIRSSASILRRHSAPTSAMPSTPLLGGRKLLRSPGPSPAAGTMSKIRPVRRGGQACSTFLTPFALALLSATLGVGGAGQGRQVFRVLEEHPPGTYVGTVATRARFTYRFSEPQALFSINASTGVISTAATIDREALPSDVFDLVVLSSQPTYPTEVRVVVGDVNDNAPSFPEPGVMEVAFKEDAAVGRQVLLDTAMDRDVGANGVNHHAYKIVSGNEEGRFRLVVTVNPSGERAFLHLATTGPLDREANPSYALAVQAEDGGSPRRYGRLQVNVTVQDANDNPPAFEKPAYRASVAEDSPVGAALLAVSAADRDAGANGEVTYSIEDEDRSPFRVHPKTGMVSTRQPLDFEARRQYTLSLRAADGGNPPLSGRATAVIQLLDVNDNDPAIRFVYLPPAARSASVDESAAPGTVAALVTVTDADSPTANGELSVSIVGGNERGHFVLHAPGVPGLRVLKVASQLDRERIPMYNLTILASDNGKPVARSATASLVVYVNDVNDHAPRFALSAYVAALSEGAPAGSYVKDVTATDADSGLNAKLRYSIVSGNDLGWFSVDESTGLVTTDGKVDREVASAVVLNISAQDQGAQPKTAYTSLTVTLLDVNDEPPLFTQTKYAATAVENSLPGLFVVSVSAADGDLGENGTVRYNFDPDMPAQYREMFRLDSVTGKVTTLKSLDREELEEYPLVVQAQDRGSPPLVSTTKVTVVVGDLNDNHPVFYPVQYFASILENEPGGTAVTTVTATDPDRGANGTVRYQLTAGDAARFQVNAVTGAVSTRVSLDREERAVYQLQVTALDGGHLRARSPAIVTITVADAQDTPPTFARDDYSFVVFENVAPGTLVGSVSASTLDLNANVTYLIVSGDQRGSFSIERSGGRIFTANAIDREEQASYQLRVVANSGGVAGEASVSVLVKDLNDNPPRFQQAVEYINVVENWEVGHSVYRASASDPDEGVNGQVSYSLKRNPHDVFHIDGESGHVTLSAAVDASADSYQVEILAQDMGMPRQHSSVVLTVQVHDVNNHAPVFDRASYEVSIAEDEPVNSRFFSVRATDKDSGKNGEVKYEIGEGNGGEKFGIFPDGQLYVRYELDRETREEYSLTVLAMDAGVEPLSSSVTVNVTVLDVNDNKPLFNSSSYVFHFSEEQEVGSLVGAVQATDADAGSNGGVTYSFEKPQVNFELDSETGRIASLRVFDREALIRQGGAASFSFSMVATDGGRPKPLQDRATVQVFVQDVNDNPPQFAKSVYQASVSESASNLTQLLRVTASDVDEGVNGALRYAINEGNEGGKFTVDASTGQITLLGSLDREETASYTLVVSATDSGTSPLAASCTVAVQVLDENDNPPRFTESLLSVDALESTRVGELLITLTASDEDTGPSGDVRYAIVAGNTHATFAIDRSTGSVFLARRLDFETQRLYRLNVSAEDGGRPPRSSATILVVHVRDFNDNPPAFLPGDVFASIMENIPIGTRVITVTARDPDADVNGELHYSIARQFPPGAHFTIDPESGEICTAAEIDREVTGGLFEVTVKATDKAIPVHTRRSALKNVTVLVTDENDNAPRFVTPTAILVDGLRAAAGSVVGTLQASDPDEAENAAVRYAVTGGDAAMFAVDPIKGELRLTASLTPSRLVYSLDVAASDRGAVSKSTAGKFVIIVGGGDGSDGGGARNSNDAPGFSQPKYRAVVREGEPAGTEVVKVEVKTPTVRGDKQSVEYFVVSARADDGSPAASLFRLDRRTGVIETSTELDRESGHGAFTLEVVAVEAKAASPRTQRAEVEISVEDVNDNPPVFAVPEMELEVEENTGEGEVIFTLSATDADQGQNALVTYSVLSGSEGAFVVDAASGVLRASRRLDREERASYVLMVRASDGTHATDARLSVAVRDANDNSPRFSRHAYSFDVAEDAAPGAVIGAVLAGDADSGPFGEVTYALASSEDSDWADGAFGLHPVTGALNVTRPLDRESRACYVLRARATDGGGLVATARLYVNVLDANDNAPSVQSDSLAAEVPEDASPGTSLLRISATDDDEGVNAELEFSISSGDPEGHFAVGNDGQLSVARALDRERQSFYNLVVQVGDRARHPPARLSSTVRVSLILTDVNDNAPAFTSPRSALAPEDSPVGAVVATVQAVDPDSGRNSYVEYALATDGEEGGGGAGAGPGPFALNTVTGELRLVRELDREARQSYALTVLAVDKGRPPLTSTATLTVTVGDANDNAPRFPRREYEAGIAEDEPPGTEVLRVSAWDPDEGANGELRYDIASGDPTGDFRLDPVLGTLAVARPLDRERTASYELAVRARDGGGPARSDTASVRVTLSDVNDCSPAFQLSPYTVHARENTQGPPVLILQVVARDDDLGSSGQVTYAAAGGNDGGAFSVSPDGRVHLLRSLDREAQPQHMLIITAADGGEPRLTGTGTVTVLVEDENDNLPRFGAAELRAAVPEDAPIGSDVALVNATDADAGPNAIISYRLRGGDGHFSVNPSTGQIITTASLDREGRESYVLEVTALDGGPAPGLSSSATLVVAITDVNDHTPRFLNAPYVAYAPSSAPAGTAVFAVTARDADAGPNGDLRFSLSGSASAGFSVDPRRGVIHAARALQGPRDDLTLTVRVSDGGAPPRSAVTTVTVRFRDAGEFPRFSPGPRSFSFREDQPPGTTITVVAARSSQRSGPVSYHLASGGNLGDVFAVDPQSGEVSVHRALDHEYQHHYELVVEARDSGFPPFSAYLKLEVDVLDINDNAPEFSSSRFWAKVPENTPPRTIVVLTAVDKDSGINGQVDYSIIDGNIGNVFRINPNSGEIRSVSTLDRENVASYELTVRATDRGSPTQHSTVKVLISVTDENDNSPRFTQIFSAHVREDAAVGFPVLRVSTLDADEGPNAAITFSLLDPSLPFSIHPSTGEITVSRRLNREDRSGYAVKVRASDPAWTVSTDVTIVVDDVNDNAPRFGQTAYYVEFPEPSDGEALVARVSASDADDGANGQVFFFMRSQTENFRVGRDSGEIHSVRPLRYRDPAGGGSGANLNKYSFVVTAMDRGRPPLSSDATVTINVVVPNANAPRFLRERYSAPVAATVRVGTRILNMSAVDPDRDVNGQVAYSIVGGNASRRFDVDAGGFLQLRASLNGDSGSTFSVTVEARDRGRPPLSSRATAIVRVTEENQYAPRFAHPPLELSLPENHPAGSSLARVTATDTDAGVNGAIVYSIASGGGSGLFDVGRESGDILLVGELDYETEKLYNLSVCAADGGWQAKTECSGVSISVTDVNDNPPMLNASDYYPVIPENAPSGTTVLVLDAVDADSPSNAVTMYSLDDGEADLFVLNQKTGVLTTQGFLDYETKQTYELTVRAYNYPDTFHYSTAQVHVQITGVNEYFPRFVQREYNFVVSESAPVGAPVGSVFATDRDAGVDGTVFYMLFGESRSKGFSVNERTGEIIVSSQLDREREASATLRVIAKNAGSIRGFDVDEVLVNVAITDANDPPVFSSALYHGRVSEAASVGTHVVGVSAHDFDSPPGWRTFSFLIQSGNAGRAFSINAHTGLIAVASPLDRESVPLYNLTVVAVDMGEPPATGTTVVVVALEDVNDNGPFLLTSSAKVTENQPAGMTVLNLEAGDPDLPPNKGPYTFQLLGSDPAWRGYFSLSSSGLLKTARPIDREQKPEFHLPVAIADAGSPSLTSTVTLHLSVLDQNDNPSEARDVRVHVNYFGSPFPGGFIGDVRPRDPDISDRFNCDLTSGPFNVFSFQPNTCRLISQPRSAEGRFELSVRGSDGKHSPATTTARVNFGSFSNATLESSVLLRLSRPKTPREFIGQYLRDFVQASDARLGSQAASVQLYAAFVYGNATHLLLSGRHTGGRYLSSDVLAAFFASNSDAIQRQSGVVVDAANVDPCAAPSPCANGGHCAKRLAVGPTATVVESASVILVSHEVLEPAVCTCTAGYAGTWCEADIDECLSTPCRHGGSCQNLPGGFACRCLPGFSGTACETDVDECLEGPCQNGGLCHNTQGGFACDCSAGFSGKICDVTVDNCASSPCYNNGSCVNTATGYSCRCPFGMSGARCELTSYGFSELSFLEVPALDGRSNVLAVEFATTRRHGLLLLTHGALSPGTAVAPDAEFLALEVRDGRVRFSYNLGQGAVHMETAQPVADGHFHTVIAKRFGAAGSLAVDDCPENSVAGYCSTSSPGTGSAQTLDVHGGRAWAGGVASLLPLLPLIRRSGISHDFVGCVREFSINGAPLQPSQALAASGVLDTCPRLEGACRARPCLSGATCLDMWSSQLCVCPDGFTGDLCEKRISEDTALGLDGTGRLDYVVRESYRRDRLLAPSSNGGRARRASGGGGDERGAAAKRGGRPGKVETASDEAEASLEVTFRTRRPEGVLLQVRETGNHTTIKLVEGRLVYVSDAGATGRVERRFSEETVDDGEWHVVRAMRRGPSLVQLVLDSRAPRDVTQPTHDFSSPAVASFSLGGLPYQPSSSPLARGKEPGLSGCVLEFKYNGMSMPFSGGSPVADAVPSDSGGALRIGCRGPDVCAEARCPPGLLCVDRWHAHACVPPGECSREPCQNGGRCSPLPATGGARGYGCHCPAEYAGRDCEVPAVCVAASCPAEHVCRADGAGRRCELVERAAFPFWAAMVIAAVGALFLLLTVLLVVLLTCRRRKAGRMKEKEDSGQAKQQQQQQQQHQQQKKKKNKGSENEAFNSGDNLPPYGADSPERKLGHETHVAKPDIIEGETPYLMADETDIGEGEDEERGMRLRSISTTPDNELEHYDIENASSIAPSDADVVQHYRQFRPHSYGNNPAPAAPSRFSLSSRHPTATCPLQPLLPLHSSGLYGSSRPLPLNTVGGRQTPVRQSPISAPSFLKAGSSLRGSPAPRDYPLAGWDGANASGMAAFPVGYTGRRSKSPLSACAGRPPSRMRLESPGVGEMAGPPVGLSLEEVERLNASSVSEVRRPRNTASLASTAEACSSSDDNNGGGGLVGGGCRFRARPLSRTLRGHHQGASDFPPPSAGDSSSSESESHDSFTCSEFEGEREKPMTFAPRPLRLGQLSEYNFGGDVGEGDDGEDAEGEEEEDENKNAATLLRSRRQRQPDGAGKGKGAKPLAVPPAFNWEAVLNLGPNLDHYMEVFVDLASLSAVENQGNGDAVNDASNEDTQNKNVDQEEYI
ncbi:protocadherin Fat 4 [Lampetra fluviatilis]